MEHKWKAGDMATVKIKSVADYDDIRLDHGIRVPASLLRPLPAPDPLTEAERRVVEAAVSEKVALADYINAPKERSMIFATCIEASHELCNATDALIALRSPPNPVAELIRATAALSTAFLSMTQWSSEPPKQVTDAIAAIDAVEKAQKP